MSPVSEAESRVMKVLWQQSPQSAEAIVSALQRDSDWHEKTIKTLLNRLLRKRAISATRDGRRYLYAPVLKHAEWRAVESQSLVERVFDGKLAPLLAHFSRHENLSADEIADLRSLLDVIERKGE